MSPEDKALIDEAGWHQNRLAGLIAQAADLAELAEEMKAKADYWRDLYYSVAGHYRRYRFFLWSTVLLGIALAWSWAPTVWRWGAA